MRRTSDIVYPAGGQRGTTVQVRVGGRFLDTASAAAISGSGIHAQIVGVDKPLTPKELTELRDKMAEMQKTAKTPAERQQLAAIRMRIGDSVRRNQSPVLSEMVTLSISIDAAAAPGPRQIRLVTALGLSNALTFAVGTVPELAEKEDKASTADSELTIALPTVVNGRLIPGDIDRAQFPLRQPGQYAPGDADRYRFAARNGQDLVCIVSARELMPYLADAVPGWFQATLTLRDASGREVAYGDDYRYQPDPVLHVKIPSDGDYVLEIKDALYRGREDFVYRIAIGEFPYITSIFPLGGPAGSKTPVQVAGWNLPAARVTMDATGAEPGVSSVTATGGELPANRVPFAIDALPETLEREPNALAKEAQRLTLPVIVNGRIQESGDVDVYSFQGKAGQPIVAEVRARRLGSPLDSSLELIGPAGTRIAFNDDFEDKASGLLTHHADSHLSATLPANGTYLLRLADVQRQGGSEFAYRLRVGPPRPDFELRVTPPEINAGAGTSVPITVHAVRRDGFSGDIAIALKDAPGGFALSGATVPAGVSSVRMTLTIAPNAAKDTSAIAVEGRATIQGRETAHRRAAGRRHDAGVRVPPPGTGRRTACVGPSAGLRAGGASGPAAWSRRDPAGWHGPRACRVSFSAHVREVRVRAERGAGRRHARRRRGRGRRSRIRLARRPGQGEGRHSRQPDRGRLRRARAAAQPAQPAPRRPPPGSADDAAGDSVRDHAGGNK